MRRLAERGYAVVTPHPWEERAGIVAVRVPDAEKTVAQLRAKGVEGSAKTGLLRFSLGFYNNETGIETAIAAM